jgi:hypothetical protein
MATFLNTTILSADIMSDPPIDEGSGFRKITNLNPATFAAADRLNIKPGGTAVFELSAKGKNKHNQDVSITLDKLGSINRQPVAQVLFNSDEITASKRTHPHDQKFIYTLITPDGTEVGHKHKHKHRPATHTYTFVGNTTITTNFSGIDVYVKTDHAAHEVVGANTTVKYTLTDPHNAAGRTIAAGLSSDQNAIVGPEHIRNRVLGY